jgi:uncharacterized protein YciI
MKYVVTYESAADSREKAQQHFPAHRARWAEFRDRGELLMIGTFSDPFVAEGVVETYTIREWNEVLSES